MSIDRGDFDAVLESDLRDLVVGQVAEGLRIEYKETTYGPRDEDKREFLKDVSAFANTQGGHLLIGVKEVEGVAKEVVGLPGVDIDSEIRRLEQIAHSGLDPRIIGLRVRRVLLESGESVIAVRVPRSWNPPHRVIAANSNRFWLRDTAGVHEANVEELRVLFSETASALDQARAIRNRRLEVIRSEDGIPVLTGHERFVVHVIPIASFSGVQSNNVESFHDNSGSFRPIACDHARGRFNFHGFLSEAMHSDGEAYSYTQVFRSGVVEAVCSDFIRDLDGGTKIIAGRPFARDFVEAISRYVFGLRDCGVPPPFVITMMLSGVRGVIYDVRGCDYGQRDRPFNEDVLVLPECLLEDYGDVPDHQRAVRPAFDAIWNAIGYARSDFYDRDGVWTDQR